MAESKPPEDEHQREQPERVEDKDPATDVSGVSDLQREDLQGLARQIVEVFRETGLAKDAEREARLEGSKLEAEAFKTQVLISSGLLVGLSAVVGILPEANMLWLLFLAFSFVLASVVFGVLQMRHIAREVADPEKAQQNWLLLFQPGRAPMSYLVAGLLVFLLYLSYNLPGGTRETLLSGTAHVVMAVSAVLLLLIFGAIARRILKWWTSRSS
jgi:hypothetical protein